MNDKLTTVSSDEFRYCLSNLLEEVRWNGKRLEITRRGTPYAVVISGPDYEFMMSAVKELAELRKSLAERNEIMESVK